MLARLVLGAVTASAMIVPALAGSMNADEARRFVTGKVFAFTCFDGTRGAGRILDDLGAAGSIQFSGSGPIRHVRLPGNTLQIRGQAVCASIKGLPFEPCFNLDKRDDRSFRGSVSGMGFAYCDFRHQGASQMLMARSVARPRSLHRREEPARAATDARAEVTTRVETPAVESAKLEPVKSEPKAEQAKSEPAKAESAPELRRSTD
ncbi:hypothetical protein [Bradyrhizobium valentinum]|uniref:Uncharacterized protein n=1 Tax=Bradyrhizobium valentinum TaxID=1518501 RepID=A0A0R3LUI5_9BRAD|nr:hypothetical protein [Bradyrhizobium valentinum]KRR11704.1 hypothetical protein CP49_30755 [Bradyrhizobium valentinum]